MSVRVLGRVQAARRCVRAGPGTESRRRRAVDRQIGRARRASGRAHRRPAKRLARLYRERPRHARKEYMVGGQLGGGGQRLERGRLSAENTPYPGRRIGTGLTSGGGGRGPPRGAAGVGGEY